MSLRENSMRLSFVARMKVINRKIKMPANRESKEFDVWEIVNGLVLSWIVNVVYPQIASTLLHTPTIYQA